MDDVLHPELWDAISYTVKVSKDLMLNLDKRNLIGFGVFAHVYLWTLL